MTLAEESGVREPLWRDDFRDGLDLVDGWALMQAGDVVIDDGVATAVDGGLRIASPATNPDTGAPAFSRGTGGVLGHLKWFASTRQRFELDGGALRFAFRVRSRTFGTAAQPFGDAVPDPAADPRLGSLVLNVMDFETGMVFDFWVCEHLVAPYYERIPVPGPEREVFGSFGPSISRAPSQWHELAIELDAGAGTARWEVDGEIVGGVDRIGLRAPEWTTVLNHGGPPEETVPSGVVMSIGVLTLLDASWPPSERGLVDLGLRYEHPREFVGGPHLFGQGVEAHISSVEVTHAGVSA